MGKRRPRFRLSPENVAVRWLRTRSQSPALAWKRDLRLAMMDAARG